MGGPGDLLRLFSFYDHSYLDTYGNEHLSIRIRFGEGVYGLCIYEDQDTNSRLSFLDWSIQLSRHPPAHSYQNEPGRAFLIVIHQNIPRIPL